eukprot:9651345-Karenia_brevis.AAC.1
MASLQDALRAPPLPKFGCMPVFKRLMTRRSLRPWPKDIHLCMPTHCTPLLMLSAASAGGNDTWVV